jgi:hypothetical protein
MVIFKGLILSSNLTFVAEKDRKKNVTLKLLLDAKPRAGAQNLGPEDSKSGMSACFETQTGTIENPIENPGAEDSKSGMSACFETQTGTYLQTHREKKHGDRWRKLLVEGRG